MWYDITMPEKEVRNLNEPVSREEMDRKVEEALYRRACGYEAEDTVVEENDKGSKERTNRYHIPGDVRAMIFWLQSRRPDKWKAKAEAETPEGTKGVNIVDDIA